MSHTEFECKEMFARLSEYIDGDLDEELCRCFSSHMQDCEPCLAFLTTLRKTVELCREQTASSAEPSLFSSQEIAEFQKAYEEARQSLSGTDE